MSALINYAVLDAARLGESISDAKKLNVSHLSLYKGRPEEELSGVAPYLFVIDGEQTYFQSWLSRNALGNSWGIYLATGVNIEVVNRHLRRFLMVQMEGTGEQVYFRFYDPRVLRVFLPIGDSQQLNELFGQVIHRFICEDEDPEFMMIFSLRNGQLHTERRPSIEIFPGLLEENIEEPSPMSGQSEKANSATKSEHPPQETTTKGQGGRRFKFIG
jgi:hypothetical protein